MKLLTKPLHKKLRRNFTARKNCKRPFGYGTDFAPVVKFFTPYANATWLIVEIEDDDDTMFGLCDLGMGEPELGCVSFGELVSMTGRFRIERDRFFQASLPLSKYADAARFRRQIVDDDEAVERALEEIKRVKRIHG